MTPKVSVLVAAFNLEQYLHQCLDSIVRQTLYDIEIIVVNDGSTDTTLEIINRFAEKDQRIKVVTQENAGLGGARRTGIGLARGKYVHFMDGDDWMDSDFLESMVANAEKYESDIVLSLHKIVEAGVKIAISSLPATLFNGRMNVRDNIDILIAPCHVWDKIFRRDLVKDIEWFKGTGEDVYFWWCVVLAAKNISVLHMALYNYRISPTSVQAQPPLVLKAFANMTRAYHVAAATKDERILGMFHLFMPAVVGHMMHRAQNSLRHNIDFCRNFYKLSTEFMALRCPLPPEIEVKKAYYQYVPFAQIDKIFRQRTFAKWSKAAGFKVGIWRKIIKRIYRLF